MDVAGTVKLAGKFTTVSTTLDIKATGVLDLDGKELAGAASVKVTVATGAQIKNISGTKFYDDSGNAITSNITVAGSTATYDWGDTNGANSDETGWKADA